MLERANDQWTKEEAAHLLNRAGFGGNPKKIDDVHAMGRHQAVAWLLEKNDAQEEWENPTTESVAEVQREIIALRRSRGEMTDEEFEKKRRELNRKAQRESRNGGRDLTSWWFHRMLQTEVPLREKMTLFWHDHFVSSIQKVRNPQVIYQQNALFRRMAWGNFKELTHEVLNDPAMILYLDVANSKKDKPNENFAREVLELFTLGEGNYTEGDIKEAARALTGYSYNRRTQEVGFNKRQWDAGPKTVLGKSGNFNGGDVIDVIFQQDAASKLLPFKLWEFFAYEKPSTEVVSYLSRGFKKGGFEVKPVLREIFLSTEFYSPRAMRTQIKSPIQFLVQMCRQLELKDLPVIYLTLSQEQLGQTLFRPPNVAGWDWGKAWINTNTLLSRYNIAGVISKGTAEANLDVPGNEQAARRGSALLKALKNRWDGPDYEVLVPRSVREDSAMLVDLLAFRFFQAPLAESERRKFMEFADAQRGHVFTNTEVAELVHLMMSTPSYQLT